MAGVLHTIEELFNKFDYAILGVLVAIVVLTVFTPVFHMVNSKLGRLGTFAAAAYFYIRWQIDVVRIPVKVDAPTPDEKIAFYRMTRNVYLEFACLILALFIFTAGRLRGVIHSLRGGKED